LEVIWIKSRNYLHCKGTLHYTAELATVGILGPYLSRKCHWRKSSVDNGKLACMVNLSRGLRVNDFYSSCEVVR